MKRVNIAYHLNRFTVVFQRVMSYVIPLALLYIAVQVAILTKSTNEKVEQIPINYPLKFDTPQNVLREPPVFHLDEAVDVEARFLNETQEAITLAADVHWILVTEAPDVGQIEPIQAPLYLTIKPGCTRIPFSNERPNSVVLLTQRLFAAGHKKVTWRLTGNNTIISQSGGGSQRFDVDEFTYVPDDVPIPDNRVEHIPETCEGL